jgi:hypothetical protein
VNHQREALATGGFPEREKGGLPEVASVPSVLDFKDHYHQDGGH